MAKTIKIAIDLATGAGFAAGMKALDALTGAIESFARLAGSAAVESVKMAADFEKTRNALEVFTGSTRRANAELQEISDLARNTPGLGLEDAEKGATRLRGLGFAAKTAQDLVAGIAKNKILSGADEQAVNRVIMNLEQLRAGSPQIKKDIQQMVLAIPTLSKVINETFGSLEKFQAALKRNPSEALEKFAEAAKKTEVGNAGLSDAFLKLQDEVLRTQRTFGEPILEPLTESVKNLTGVLAENKETWSSWGKYVGDVIDGFNAGAAQRQRSGAIFEIQKEKYNKISAFDAYTKYGTIYPSYSSFSVSEAEIEEYLKRTAASSNPSTISMFDNLAKKGADYGLKKRAGEFMKNRDPLNLAGNISDLLAPTLSGKTQSEIDADTKAAYDKQREDKERARLRDLADLKRNSDAATAILKNRYDVEQALLDRNLRYTNEQELEYISKSAQIKQNFYTSERARITGYYSKLIALTEEGSDEQLKAIEDQKKELAKLNSQEVADAYKSQRAVLEIEKKIQDERRQNLLQFNSLQVTSIQQGNAKQLFELNRGLNNGSVSYQQYFDKQISIANESLTSLLELNRKNLELELQNKSLTTEQITNIRKNSLLEEQRLIQENSEKIYQIQRESVERQKDLISTYASFASNIISSAADIQGGFADLFFGDRSTGRQSRTAAETLSKTYLDEFNRLNEELRKKNEIRAAEQVRLDNAKDGGYEKTQNSRDLLDRLTNEIGEIEIQIESLKRYGVLQRQAQDLFNTFKATPEGVDKLQGKFLEQKQKAELANINLQIAAQERLLSLELTAYEREKESLKLTELRQQRDAIDIRHLAEQQELYRKSIDGLREYIQALKDGDKQATAFAQNAAIKNILESQAGLLEENIYLQEKLSRVGEDSAARYKNAWLNAQLEIKEANIRANESIIRSNVILDDAGNVHSEQVKARVLEHLAQQKTQSEIVADSIINVYDKATSGIDKLLDRAGLGKVPILGDIAKGFVKNQFTKLFRGTLDRFFPGLSEQFEKTGNPMIDTLKESQVILKQIESNTRGGNSGDPIKSALSKFGINIGGSTPPFNPNSSGGWWQNLQQMIFGGGNSQQGFPYAMNAHEAIHNQQGGGGFGSIFGKGGLFGSKGFGMNAGTVGGIGSIASVAGGLIGGRFGETLSLAGMGAQIGSNFGIWGGVIGGAIGLGIGLFKSLFGRGGAEKALKKAAMNAYNVDIKDKSVLQTLKSIGEAKFGKGKVGSQSVADQVVRLPEAVELIQSYADSSGQKGNKALNLSRLGDENYSGNYTRSAFSGFDASGNVGGLSSGTSNFINGTAYRFTAPASNYSTASAFANPTPFAGINREISRKFDDMIALLNSVARSADAIDGNTGVLSVSSPHDIVTIGARTATREIYEANNKEIYNGGARLAEKANKGLGSY